MKMLSKDPILQVQNKRATWNTLIGGLLAIAGAMAADITVTTPNDENNGSLDPSLGSGTSLREAVLHAPAGSRIVFAPALNGFRYSLNEGQIVIGRNLTIDGSTLTIGVEVDAQEMSRVFEVQSGKTVSMIGLRIAGGKVAGDGGGILNAGNLTLKDCELTSNQAGGGGGAIENRGTVALTACTLAGNTAAVGGGGIEHAAGVLTLTNCTMTGNSAQWGGAIDGDGSSTIRLYSCTVSGNHASDKGGGIEETTGTLLLENSIVAGNTAPNSGPDLKASAINTQLGVNLLSSTNGLGGGFAGVVAAPDLYALGAYGGPTRTMPPQAGSPAIDAGGATALTVDQRGLARVVGSKVDIGAVEARLSWIVTTAADSGPGSLRNAILQATPGAAILFDPSLDHSTITLTSGPLILDKSLIIDATARTDLAVSGRGPTRVVEVAAGGTSRIAGLHISHVRVWPGVGEGGGIHNAGTLLLEDCVVSKGIAEKGGGIFNEAGGNLTLANCELRSNTALYGGALCNEGVTRIFRSIVHFNGTFENEVAAGGGASNSGRLEIFDSTFRQNWGWFVAAIDSGGERSHLTITRSTIEDNESLDSVGGVCVGGEGGEIRDCSFIGNYSVSGTAGAIYHFGGNLAVTQCTIFDNVASADFGGGIYTRAALKAESCTISDNTAGAEGGGIYVDSMGQLSLVNSIVAGNFAGEAGPDIRGTIHTQTGVNLVGSSDGIDNPFSGIVADPMLGPLADNGGPTLTMLPLPGSPAIDAGGSTDLSVDQRGFPRVLGASVDIGSVETEPVTADWIVNTTADENDGAGVGNVSLREAIAESPPGSVITFAPSVNAQGILLTAGTLVIGKDLTLDASSLLAGIGVSGNDRFRVFDIAAGSNVSMRNLSIVDGRVPAGGGGIRNGGHLTLTDCEVAYCSTGDDGAGIHNSGSLVLTDSRITDNIAANSGGGIASQGPVSIRSCVVSSNNADNGGAIYNDGAILTIEDSTLGNNSADDTPGGGAIDNDNGGEVSLTRSTLSGNISATGGGAIENDGKLTILACTLSGNTAAVGGGAIEHAAGILDLTSSTLAGNSAKYGGAIDGDGTSTIRLNCCTVATNHAGDKGGGIEETTGTLVLENSIVGANTAVNSGPDLKVSSINSELGVNLVSSTNGLGGAFHGIVADPQLYPLANYGGPTQTISPRSTSPVIDAGGSTTLTVDQRGLPRMDGRWVDIGSFESQGHLMVTQTLDSGAGSLREIIGLARPGSLIPFAPHLDGKTINLTSGPLVIGKDLDIDASALPRGVTFTGEVTRAFDITAGNHVTMKGLIVSGFYSPWDDGAAIRNAGHLELTGCSLTENTAMNGGAIFSGEEAVLAMTDCELAHNVGECVGGAICSEGAVTLTRTLVFSNGTGEDDGYGGGVSSGGELMMVDSVIRNNYARVVGGIDSNGSLTMLRCTVEGNEAWDGDAGGIGLGGTGGSIADTTIAGNFALGDGGGIKHGFGALTLTNCTIEGNSTSADLGGGIFTQADLRVESCTISGNGGAWEGGGIYVDPHGWHSDGRLTLVNSIVAGNDSAESGPDIRGPIEAELGVNLLGSTDGVTTPFAGIVADPMLAPLDDYGGPTLTMLPLTGSPAIDAGGATPLTLDQRGFTRVVGARVDIGSVETGNVIPP